MELLILFTDKKLFTFQSIHNTQNDQILAKNKKDIALEDWALFRRQKPQSVMVWAWVTTEVWITPLIFIEEFSFKVNKHVYLALLKDNVLPWLPSEYSDAPNVFTQDGAPARNANIVQARCSENFPAFLEQINVAPIHPLPQHHGLCNVIHPWEQGFCKIP